MKKKDLTTTSERTGDDDLKLLCGRASLRWDHAHYIRLQSPKKRPKSLQGDQTESDATCIC